MSEKSEHLNIQHSKNHKSIKGQVKSIDFQNDGYFIVYIPSLKLSSYGSNLAEANKMMGDIVLPDFCETLISQPIDKVLAEFKSLGWSQNAFFKKQLSKSAHVDVEGILRDFELSEDTKINERLVEVAA